MQTATSTPVQIVQVLQALIVMFVAAPPLIRAMLPAPRGAGQRGRRGDVQGVERVTSSSAQPRRPGCRSCCPRSRRGASWGGRFAAPVTFAVFGLVDILVFGLHAHG